MKGKLVTYWIITGFVSALMLFNAAAYLTSEPHAVTGFRTLGYPDYFRFFLGGAKVLGSVVLLVPGLKIIKEWAYTGFGITFLGALVSHLACGQHKEAIAPVVAFVLLTVSYYLRPASRRVVDASVVRMDAVPSV